MADRELRIRVVGDAASGVKALRDTAGAADKVHPSAKTASDAMGTVKDKLLGLVPGGQAASGALSKITASSSSAGMSMGGALAGGAAAGALAIADLGIQGVQKFSALTGEISKFKNVSGASAQEASKLVAVAKGFGIETDTLSAAIFKMGSNLETAPDKFKALGIEIAHNKDGTVDLVGTLQNASKAYMATTDATKKDAIAKQLGGKAGMALIPILKGGSAAIKEFGDAAKKRGMVFSDDDLKQGAEYRKSMRELQQAVQGVEISLGKGLVPALTSTAHELTTITDAANSATRPIGGLATIFKGAVTGLTPVLGPLKQASDAMHKSGDAADKAKASQEQLTEATKAGVPVTDDMTSADVDAATAAKQLADETKRTTDATAAYTRAVEQKIQATAAAIDSDLAFRNAENALADANGTVTEKQTALNEAIRDHGAKSVEAATAARDLTKAQQDSIGAVVADAEAFLRLKEDQAAAHGETLTVIEKNDVLMQRLQDLANALGPNSPLRAQLQGYIDQLKQVPRDVRTDILTTFRQEGSRVQQRAAGGAASGVTLVGERGPELVDLPGGSYVHNAGDTARMLAGSGGGGNTYITVHNVNMPPGSDGPALVRSLKEYSRRNGRSWLDRM